MCLIISNKMAAGLYVPRGKPGMYIFPHKARFSRGRSLRPREQRAWLSGRWVLMSKMSLFNYKTFNF